MKDKTVKEIFSTNLRNKLKARRSTQAELAKFLGTSQVSVSHWVNGEILPRPNTIDRIGVFLGCSSEDLMTDGEREAELTPEDVIAEELRDNPRLMRLMIYAMKLSDADLDRLIERVKK